MKYRRFLFQGDSITDGNRGRTNDPNHILGHSHAFSIGSRLMADFPELHLEFFNRGVSGDSHVEMEKRWQEDCLDLHADVLSILIGTNGSRQACGIYTSRDKEHPDGLAPEQSLENFEASMYRMLSAARQDNPDILLVICLPFRYAVPNFSEEENEMILSVIRTRREVLQRLARSFGAVTVDFQAALDQAIKLNNDRSYWCWDGVHVTVAGYEILARTWLKCVKKHIDFLADYAVKKV